MYFRGTTSHPLWFGGLDIVLQGYVDANMAGDKDNRMSTIGCVFNIGVRRVSWISKWQKNVALSTMEAKYVVATEASKEMIWIQRFMEELSKEHAITCCIVTTRVLFILQTTQLSILRLDIYISNTI